MVHITSSLNSSFIVLSVSDQSDRWAVRRFLEHERHSRFEVPNKILGLGCFAHRDPLAGLEALRGNDHGAVTGLLTVERLLAGGI